MKNVLKISILGDICPAWGFRNSFDAGNTELIFGDVLPEIRRADITVANLEAPLSNAGAPINKTGPCLRGKPEDMKVLQDAGIQLVSFANNHILDYGEEALRETMRAAKERGLLHFGAGENQNEAAKAVYVEKNGWKIGFLSFCEAEFSYTDGDRPGANLFDPYVSLAQITKAKASCDFLIVLFHGGIEHYRYPSPLLQKKCRAMVTAGADLVLCQHSHCIGTQEVFQNATILYGQGNAIFGRKAFDAWNYGLLVSVELQEANAEVSYRVFEAMDHGIRFANLEAENAILKRMHEESKCCKDPDALKTNWDAFCERQEAEYLPSLYAWNRVMNKLNRMLHNGLANLRFSKRQQLVTMNLIRCDAHREVVQTVLENRQKEQKQ